LESSKYTSEEGIGMVIIFKPSSEDIEEFFRVVLSDRSKAVGKIFWIVK